MQSRGMETAPPECALLGEKEALRSGPRRGQEVTGERGVRRGSAHASSVTCGTTSLTCDSTEFSRLAVQKGRRRRTGKQEVPRSAPLREGEDAVPNLKSFFL